MTRVADTSALYALIDGADGHHVQARKALSDPEPIVVPSEIFVETIDLVGYRKGKEAAKKAARLLLALPNLAIAEPIHMEAAVAIHANHGVVSLADSCVVQTCRALAASPLTFDRGILRALE